MTNTATETPIAFTGQSAGKPKVGCGHPRHQQTWRRTDRGYAATWICAICHPPAEGIDIEWLGTRTDRVELASPARRADAGLVRLVL